MFWGCMSIHGFGPLTTVSGRVNSQEYQQILIDNALPEICYVWEHLDSGMEFMQDDAGVHVSRFTMQMLELHGIPTLEWPPDSPDLNPIEKVWNFL